VNRLSRSPRGRRSPYPHVSLRNDRTPKEEALRFLRGRVGRYKIPKYLQFVEELPKTASGKIQKYLLKEEHQSGSTKSPAYRQAGKHQITNKFQLINFEITNKSL
jgi:acyl-coenzyme A synthetase/AMP-(fatty) acid ligase